mgnify:CR=1 FL=1
MGILKELLGYEAQQFLLYFQRRPASCQTSTVGHAKYVGIHRQGIVAKCGVEDDIGSLTPHTRKSFQSSPLTRHFAAMSLDQ